MGNNTGEAVEEKCPQCKGELTIKFIRPWGSYSCYCYGCRKPWSVNTKTGEIKLVIIGY